MHAFSISNRKNPNQNATYRIAFLPCFEEMNLGLAWTTLIYVPIALKTHVVSKPDKPDVENQLRVKVVF